MSLQAVISEARRIIDDAEGRLDNLPCKDPATNFYRGKISAVEHILKLEVMTDGIAMPNQTLIDAEHKLLLGPIALARAMNTNYDTYKDWKSGRSNMTGVAVRCLELLLMYPRTAKKLAKRPESE